MNMEEEILKLQNKVESLAQHIKELEDETKSIYASKEYVTIYVDNMIGHLNIATDPLTGDSPITGYIPLDIERTLKHFNKAQDYYNINDWRSILLSYDRYAKVANINPYIVIAQMVKETDWGRSWWSQRPRRNPAGLGVTGETQSNPPFDRNGWAEDRGVWRKGYSSVSWDISAMAHIGHLLAYLHTDQDLNAEQRTLVAHDPRASVVKRGEVKLLKDLDGKWAYPGIGYGNSIATLANALKQ